MGVIIEVTAVCKTIGKCKRRRFVRTVNKQTKYIKVVWLCNYLEFGIFPK